MHNDSGAIAGPAQAGYGKRIFTYESDAEGGCVYHRGSFVDLAGAGSGKTTVLVNRIANIVKYGCAYGAREFSVSLTEEEIRMLEEYRDGTQEYTDEIADLLAVRPAKPWQILAITFTNKAAGELKERLEAMLGPDGQDIWASTFHSTCARILRRDGESIGYTSHFTIYDTDDSKRVMKECQRLLNIDDKMLSHKTLLHEISHARIASSPQKTI